VRVFDDSESDLLILNDLNGEKQAKTAQNFSYLFFFFPDFRRLRSWMWLGLW
jgi:hypothetical protein